MKKRILLMSLFVFFSSLVFTQNIKISVQDSLLSLKLQSKGFEAGQLGDFEEALSNFSQKYKLLQKIYGSDNYRLASPLSNMGIQYKNLQNLDKALELFKDAEKLYISEFGENYVWLGAIYSNLGIIYSVNGDYNQALKYQQNALRILKMDSLKFNDLFQTLKYNLIETQLKLGHNDIAIQYAQSNIKTIPARLKPRLLDLIALAYNKDGKYQLSEKYYLSAIKSWNDNRGENNIELVTEYLAYSSFLLTQKNYEKAFLFSTKAKEIVSKFYKDKSTTYAEVESNFGDYYAMKSSEANQIEDFRTQRKTNLKQSMQFFQNAIVALVDSFQIKDPLVDPPLKNIISEIQLIEYFKKKASAMEKLADIYLSEFDYENSIKYLKAGLNALSRTTQLINRLQIGFENEDSKLFLSQNQESTYYEAINICFNLYNQTKLSTYANQAFEFSERSKSSNLLASLKDVKAKEYGGIPDSLLKRENTLKGNIANYTSMLFEVNQSKEHDIQKANLYSAKIFKFNEEYNRLIHSFEKSYPQYYALKFENKVIGITDIQPKLSTRQALIEYYVKEPDLVGDMGEIYRFVVTKDSLSLTRENIDYSYVKNIQSVHNFLTNPKYLYTKKKDFIEYAEAAYGLYEKLLKPTSRKINGKDLTIIPHDKLSYIPFDALLSQMPDTSSMNFRNLNYLVRDYAINYSYSATLLYNYSNQKKLAQNNLMVFSPQYISDEPRTEKESSIQHFFNPLPGAKDEVKGISAFIHAETYIDQFAQESTFKEKAAEFDILHLAMHTIINDSIPMFSKLVFSKPDQNAANDGFLNAYEIYNLKLNARLAVLSACETGSGKLQRGEGVMSMARGFIYAGCPAIVMTLWQVEDKSGVKIMEDFYYYLSKGKRKDVALRMAKLNHLSNSDPLTAHPHYWLGYVNIGNPEPLYTSKNIYFVLLLIIIALLVFSDWYFRIRPRKNRGHV